MKRTLPLFLLLALALTGCSASGGVGAASTASYRQVNAQEAIDMMASETDFIILDVRTQQEYESGHIPNAVCIPNETIPANGTETVSGLPDKEQPIFVYCRSGNRSKQAAAKLAQLGYTHIVEFGGIQSWPGEITAP